VRKTIETHHSQFWNKAVNDVDGGPLFDFRFRLRTLLFAVTATCLFLALCSLIAIENAFPILTLGMTALAVWLATRNAPRYLGILIACHLIIAMLLIVGPIASYHINGRAWYDYGLSPWNPPPFHFDDGNVGIGDYDPKYTRPAVWPVIGPVMYVMSWAGVGLMIFPPIAPVVSIAVFVLAIRLRHVLTKWQSRFVWASWTIGLVPVLYLLFWGLKVFDWIAD
jgi:hypothetical protein